MNTQKILEERLQYCKEQNGILECKNCGLTQEMVDALIQEVREEERGWIKSIINTGGGGL